MVDPGGSPVTAARKIECPACGGSIEVKAAGYTVTVACRYCGSLLDVANPDVRLIEEYHRATSQLQIPLGNRGTIDDVEWEVVGWQGRSDDEVRWDEYLLFNPYSGYRWLIQSEGEWQFGGMITDPPEMGSGSVLWRGKHYSQDYDPVTSTTDSVVGEFYWRVRVGDSVVGTTYSAGKQTLSVERSGDELNWTSLYSLGHANVPGSFGVGPRRGGRRNAGAPDERPPGYGSPEGLFGKLKNEYRNAEGMGVDDLFSMLFYGVIAAVAITFIMAGFGWSSARFSSAIDIAVDAPAQTATLGSLTVNRPYQFITVTARSGDFQNKWVDLDYSLVDRKTQRSIDAYGLVEQYTGRDSDGIWREGSYSNNVLFARVPRGSYDLVVEASAHSWVRPSLSTSYSSYDPPPVWQSPIIHIYFTAKNGGFAWGNFWLFMFLIFGLPAIILFWRRSQED